MASKLGKIVVGGLSTLVGVGLATYIFLSKEEDIRWNIVHAEGVPVESKETLPTRDEQIKSLETESFDILIIGGGATGAGCALDAVTRGLKTALVEADDFSSGSSSRSTKLIHGGVRYLQSAIMQLDVVQYKMVKEALHERASLLKSAPHLTRSLPIMLPVYTWWQVPYFWVGIKMYDVVAGRKVLKSSYVLSKKNALELFPMLRADQLCGAIIYYDGQMDDARLNLAIALTATRYGATVANHVSVTGLKKEKNEQGQEVVCGVEVQDELTGKKWSVPAKCVINATGPFTDSIRKMDNPDVKEICSPSSGVHVTLPGYYSPEQMGLLDPSTADGRVIFFLPWQKHTIAGTTDVPCEVTFHPKPSEDEIMFILGEIKSYLSPDIEVRRGDVLSAWSGIRPLVSDPNKPNTQSLARNHIIHVSDSKLVTIAGGKWTTYRSMAQQTIDAAIHACGLTPQHKCSKTDGLLLEGAHGWTPIMYIRLVQDFGLESEVAQHLASSYGDRAFDVAKMASPTGKRWPIIGKKIHPEFPYIDAEIRYGVKEYAVTAVDMIARRLRLSFLNVEAAREALPDVINIMAEELGWSEDEKKKQSDQTIEFLQEEMGEIVNRTGSDKLAINLSKEELHSYIKRFRTIDKGRKGYISINDICKNLKEQDEKEVSCIELHNILREVDTSMNGQVELDEYLQIMSAIKSGSVAYSEIARMTKTEENQKHEMDMFKKEIPVERSCGGL